MPTATDLVTDLPADFEVFGQAVDTRLKALQPGTTLGDLTYSSATANTNTRLPIGTSGQVLAVSGGVPAWTTTADVTPLTTKGDLFTFTTVDARLGVGANGTVLTADSAEATGLKWAAASGGLTLVKRATTSGAVNTGSTFDNVFTSTYRTYLVVIETWTAATNTDDPKFQMRYSGTTESGAVYYGGTTEITRTGSQATTTNTGTTAFTLGTQVGWTGGEGSNYTMTFNKVGNTSQVAQGYFIGYGESSQSTITGAFLAAQARTYDGFLLSAASNIAVTVAVYGLAI
jgi:hypothetical protein